MEELSIDEEMEIRAVFHVVIGVLGTYQQRTVGGQTVQR
jgi:hypothetical protein